MPNGLESAAVRKLIYQLAGNPDPDENNISDAAEIAVERMNELDERVKTLEGATGVNLDNADYKNLSRAAKVKTIRESLAEKAKATRNGKASMDYNEIMAVWDYQPSPGHATELAKDAGDAPGYNHEKHDDKNDRVVFTGEKQP